MSRLAKPRPQPARSTSTITDVNEAPSYAGTQTRYVAENAWKVEGVEPNEELKRDDQDGQARHAGKHIGRCRGRRILTCNTDLDLYRTTVTAGGDPVDGRLTPMLRIITGLRADTMVTDRVLYTLSGPDAMYFGIYRATGQIIGFRKFWTLSPCPQVKSTSPYRSLPPTGQASAIPLTLKSTSLMSTSRRSMLSA